MMIFFILHIIYVDNENVVTVTLLIVVYLNIFRYFKTLTD